jgi:hypothetical protein
MSSRIRRLSLEADRSGPVAAPRSQNPIGPVLDGNWYLNIERAYREFRGEPSDKPWDQAKTFDEIYGVARKQGLDPTF